MSRREYEASATIGALLAAGWLGLALAAGVLGCRPDDADRVSQTTQDDVDHGSDASDGFDVAALDVADPVERIRRFMDELDELGPEEFPAAAERLQGRVDEWAEFEARLFVWAWSEHDPAGALDGALGWSQAQRNAVSYAAVRSWARIDPIAAQEAVRLELETADSGLATSLLSGLAFGWTENGDYDGALALIESRFSALVHREALTEMLIEKMLAAEGLEASIEWAERLAARHEDRAFLATVFRKLGRNAVRIDPERTASWLDQFQGDPAVMNRARRAAAVMWGRDDAPAALDWMLAQPNDNSRRISGLTTILTDWVMRDEDAALAWLRKAPDDPGLDEGVARTAELVARRSPRAALEWIPYVRTPSAREAALAAVATTWMRSDPAAAEAWLAEAGLGASILAQIRANATTPAAPPTQPRRPRAEE